MAIQIRVMLSHCRLKYFDPSASPDHPLAKVFREMGAPSQSSAAAWKSARDKRLRGRPCPFLNFRDSPAGSPAVKDEPEDKSLASMVYDPCTGIARLLYSDGSAKNADQYRATDEGFLEAVWLGEGCLDNDLTHLLDVPNGRRFFIRV